MNATIEVVPVFGSSCEANEFVLKLAYLIIPMKLKKDSANFKAAFLKIKIFSGFNSLWKIPFLRNRFGKYVSSVCTP